MKSNPRQRIAAFTLIEMMAVITIIVILAALVVGGFGFVTERQAKEKARIQLALMGKALEDYKLDMGKYPPTPASDTTNGIGNSQILFSALYYDSDADNVGSPGDSNQRLYLPELDPATSKQGWTTGIATATTKIIDPWGNEYRYRTATGDTGTRNASAINPDFDLWSTGKNGETNTASNSSAADIKRNADDIRNF